MSKIWTICLCASLALLVGCSSGGKKVSRIDSNSVTDLSGAWNDTDSRLVADEMITDCLNRPWYQAMIQQKNGQVPTVVIGQVRNKSHEHINVETFIKDIERALINSGKADFVANAEERSELRNELASQAGNATEETRKDAGQEHRHAQLHRGPGRWRTGHLLPGRHGTHRHPEPQESLDRRQEDQEVRLPVQRKDVMHLHCNV